MKDVLGALTRNWVKPHIILGNKSPLCVVDNKKGWISIHRYPAFVNPDPHSVGFSSFLS